MLETDGVAQAAEIEARFGSFQWAFALVQRFTGREKWDAIARRCTEDLLGYLVLGRFRRGPPMTALPLGLQREIRAFFNSYTNACRLADARLIQASDAAAMTTLADSRLPASSCPTPSTPSTPCSESTTAPRGPTWARGTAPT